jgi:hypothetical protein
MRGGWWLVFLGCGGGDPKEPDSGTESASGTIAAEDCADGVDNDEDGDVDCDDSDCADASECEAGTTPTTSTTGAVSDADGDGYTVEDGDCNDTLPEVNPGAEDTVGNDVDDNCDGTDGVDADQDGAASRASGGDDCNDADPDIAAPIDWYKDDDSDGWGANVPPVTDCLAPTGHSQLTGDCEDRNPGVHPDADDDQCDGVDNNCNGQADDHHAVECRCAGLDEPTCMDSDCRPMYGDSFPEPVALSCPLDPLELPSWESGAIDYAWGCFGDDYMAITGLSASMVDSMVSARGAGDTWEVSGSLSVSIGTKRDPFTIDFAIYCIYGDCPAFLEQTWNWSVPLTLSVDEKGRALLEAGEVVLEPAEMSLTHLDGYCASLLEDALDLLGSDVAEIVSDLSGPYIEEVIRELAVGVQVGLEGRYPPDEFVSCATPLDCEHGLSYGDAGAGCALSLETCPEPGWVPCDGLPDWALECR